MKQRGAFKIENRSSAFDPLLDPIARSDERARRVLESLRSEIAEGGGRGLRIRQIFKLGGVVVAAGCGPAPVRGPLDLPPDQWLCDATRQHPGPARCPVSLDQGRLIQLGR